MRFFLRAPISVPAFGVSISPEPFISPSKMSSMPPLSPTPSSGMFGSISVMGLSISGKVILGSMISVVSGFVSRGSVIVRAVVVSGFFGSVVESVVCAVVSLGVVFAVVSVVVPQPYAIDIQSRTAPAIKTERYYFIYSPCAPFL